MWCSSCASRELNNGQEDVKVLQPLLGALGYIGDDDELSIPEFVSRGQLEAMIHALQPPKPKVCHCPCTVNLSVLDPGG